MNETTLSESETAPAAKPEKKKKEEGSFVWFLVKLVIAVALFRTLLFTSFSIPSESMLPRLMIGDYLFAAKWPYGYSQASMPFDIKAWNGRVPAGVPTRGDVVIFKHPVDRVDYVKRVIGLPGDTVQVIDGVLHINGQPVKKEPAGDFLRPIAPDVSCFKTTFATRLADGSFACRYPRFRETLPNGVSYNVLDMGPAEISFQYNVDPDNTEPVIVPEGHLFMMGDNRDNSQDSRFPAVAGGGVGLVPIENVVGRASFMFFSTDGTAEWIKPWTWFTAARWSRIGRPI